MGVAAFSKDLTDGEKIKTVEGQSVTASIYMGNRVFINNALVTTADVAASNGVIHIIDTVLSMPAKPKPTIIERITSMPELSIFQFAYVSALETVENNNEYYPPSGLDGILSVDGPLTGFAPTNEAFQKLPKGVLDHLLAPENIIGLQSLLSYHVVRGAELHTGCNKGSEQPGDVASLGRPCGQLDLETNSFVNTLQGQGINVGYHKRCPISGCDETVILSPDNIDYRTSTLSKIVGTDVQASNGIIHLIDNVLIPPAPTRTILQSAELSGYTTFVTALKAANLTAALDGDGPFTVFVPSNEAFLSLATDFRVMQSAKGFVCFPEANLGMRLSKAFAELAKAKLGAKALRVGFLTAKRFDSAAALGHGLVDELCDPAELVQTAVAMASSLMPSALKFQNYNSEAYSMMKKELYTDAYRALVIGVASSLPESRL